jgi:hypothetical protein
MNFEGQDRETEDVQAALRHFRESVHGWSEQEFGRARVVRRSRWDAMFQLIARPAVGWATAALLVAASVGVPLAVHHERELAVERRLVIERQQQLALAEDKAKQQAATAMSDDELLTHVDSDIAQAAPDAMEPLASLMSETAAK